MSIETFEKAAQAAIKAAQEANAQETAADVQALLDAVKGDRSNQEGKVADPVERNTLSLAIYGALVAAKRNMAAAPPILWPQLETLECDLLKLLSESKRPT